MPFQMKPRPGGRSILMAAEPMASDSYAIVTTYRAEVRLFHPLGVSYNGYPAVSPVISELSSSLQRDVDKIRSGKLAHLAAIYRHSTGGDPDDAWLTSMANELNRPLVCTGVSIGRPLILSMPKGLRGQFDLGTIKQIAIHNTGEGPVLVR